jgi:NAD(P)-dependent dehydrogenase (short-subunit alcohol dehydrogenase family)
MTTSPPSESPLAVVSGASVGLGRALAVEFSRRGVDVIALGRTLAELETTASLAAGARIVPMQVDVADPDAVALAFQEIRETAGDPTILVNNAAVYPRRDFLAETPHEFMACVAVNLGGAVNCSHAALKSMIRTGRGRIVNVGSFADLAPMPGAGAYSVSKGALRIFSRALVADLGDRFPDIVVTTWMPGILATRMGLPDGLDPAVAARWGVELALSNDRDLNGTVFERDTQMAEPRSLKRRMVEKLLRRTASRRRLDPPPPEKHQESTAP